MADVGQTASLSRPWGQTSSLSYGFSYFHSCISCLERSKICPTSAPYVRSMTKLKEPVLGSVACYGTMQSQNLNIIINRSVFRYA